MGSETEDLLGIRGKEKPSPGTGKEPENTSAKRGVLVGAAWGVALAIPAVPLMAFLGVKTVLLILYFPLGVVSFFRLFWHGDEIRMLAAAWFIYAAITVLLLDVRSWKLFRVFYVVLVLLLLLNVGGCLHILQGGVNGYWK